MSIKGNTYYKYVQIPIVEYDLGEIMIDIITNNAEFRNFGIQRKVNSDSSYEVKGAVLTYQENYTIYQNNDGSDIIKLNGIYLPTLPNYYEIYEGTFQLNTNSQPSNNGVFTLPQKDGVIENYNTTVNDKSYTILQ